MGPLFRKRHLQLLLAREPRAVERWFHSYCDTLYTFIYYRIGKDGELAADLVQETFVRALQHIEQFDARRGTMFAWLTCISRNCIARALRTRGGNASAKRIWQNVDADLLRAFERIATEPLPDEVVELRETAELVQMTLANIPANYAQLLRAYYYDNETLRTIATSKGMSMGAAKAVLYRARQAFKEAFLRLARPFDGFDRVKGAVDE
jgi:RNA polymerase sigma factor (sigma-70 family)